jgi:transposase InsO family protein
MCKILHFAPSTYYDALTRQPSARELRDLELETEIRRIYDESKSLYGQRKVWRQLRRDGIHVARSTVARIMRRMGLCGVRRGKKWKTTYPDKEAQRPADLVNRDFKVDRPNQLWVADFTYVKTKQGMTYAAFVIDAYSRRIMGWQTSNNMRTDLALDALEMALWQRKKQNKKNDKLIHHSDLGKQYLSVIYTERLEEAGLEISCGSKGDAYDNALAETINGLYKTEVINRRNYWNNLNEVEFATLIWVDWFNNKRLLEPIGYVPPAEYEEMYYSGIVSSQESQDEAA